MVKNRTDKDKNLLTLFVWCGTVARSASHAYEVHDKFYWRHKMQVNSVVQKTKPKNKKVNSTNLKEAPKQAPKTKIVEVDTPASYTPRFNQKTKTKSQTVVKVHVELSPVELWKKAVNKQILKIGRDSISMWRCAFFGRMPPQHSINSFGIEDIEQVKAMQWCIVNMKIVPEELDAAKKNGSKLTSLMKFDGQPYNVTFITMWDLT